MGVQQSGILSWWGFGEGPYKQAVRDLVGLLVYVRESEKSIRCDIGFRVIVFPFVFLTAANLIKQEYWKDVH